MRSLWIAFLVIASLGSIYPFNFSASAADWSSVSIFLQSCCKRLGRGDILGNVLLFLPIGFTGVFAAMEQRGCAGRFVFAMWTGTLVALVLQLLQFYLPTRDENLQDVAWNAVGIAGGAAVAAVFARWSRTSDSSSPGITLVPAALIAAWLCYRLIPFVPSLDFGSIKNSLKPLLLTPHLSISHVFHDAAAWLVVGYLLQHVQRGRNWSQWLAALMALTFLAEILIVSNAISASNVLGALIALLLWRLSSRSGHQSAGFVALFLLVALFVSGLTPLSLSNLPRDFAWLPFQGFLGGSMYLDALSAADKVFLYGALVFVLWQTSLRRSAGLLLGVIAVFTIEWLQRYVIGHTPEITDPLLVVFAAIAIVALEKQEGENAETGGAASAPVLRVSSGRDRGDASTWHRQEINLRQQQMTLLSRLSLELDCSKSGVARKILDRFIHEFSGANSGVQQALAEAVAQGNGQPGAPAVEKWQTLAVNLTPTHVAYLTRVADAAEISVSRVLRRILQRFADDLEERDSAAAGE